MKRIFRLVWLFIIAFIGISNIKALTNGIYTIESALNENMVIDLNGAKTNDKTNIQLYTSNNTGAQRWKVEKLNDDYYRISSLLDNNKVLDVDGAKKSNGTNIQLYKSNGTDAQQWIIKDAGNGYYYIISKCNNLYMDVNGAKQSNGTNIQMYKGNDTNAQKFRFVEVLEGKQALEDGNYIISSALSDNKFLDVKGGSFNNKSNVQIYESNNSWAQVWTFKYLYNGYYRISSTIENNYVLDVDGAKTVSGTNVQLYKNNNTNAQQWLIKDNGDGYFNIISKNGHYNLFLDVNAANSNNGTNIQLYRGNSTNAQKFKITKTDMQPLDNGLYTLTSKVSNKNISIDGDRLANGANIELNDINDSNGQKWYVKYIKDGYYSILSAFNDKYSLDLAGATNKVGTNIQLYHINNNDAQKWYIRYVNGNYVISSKISGLTLDLNGTVNDYGTNIQANTLFSSDSQQFIINSTGLNDNLPNYDNADIQDGYYTISSALSKNMVLDINGGSKINGTNLQMYTSNSTLAQIFHVKKLTNGYYSVTSSLNRKTAIDITGNSKEAGANVQLYRANGTDAQQWLIKDTADGYVTFISKNAGLGLSVSSSNVANGTNVFMNTLTFGSHQKFKLTKYTGKKIYTGIDVSKWQGNIDWEKVAKTNIGFVIIRGGYGDNRLEYDDEKFEKYVAACEKYNIPYGIYLYSYATDTGNTITGAGDEAKHMLRLIDKIGADDYSPNLGTKVFLDMEDDSTKGVGKTTLTNIADTFCSKIETNGYSCGIYANKTWFTNYLNTNTLQKKYEIWLAEWINKNTLVDFNIAKNSKPTYSLTSYKYWQFTSNGRLNGISGNVDLDLGYDIFD